MVMLTWHHITPVCWIISPQVALCRCSELSLTEIFFSTFVLFSTLPLFCFHNAKSGLFLQESEAFHLQCLSTLLWKAAFLWPLSHTLPAVCLFGGVSLFLSLPLICCPCSFLSHSGLSYIMHVKQTDMSESLRCMAVPSLHLHPPREWEGQVSKVQA